jgi:hypothetical protein
MVNAKWRQRRLWTIETDLLDDDCVAYDAITPLSFAFAELASKSLSFLSRNESRLERVYHRALKTLLELQRFRNQNIQKRTESQIHQPEFLTPPQNHHESPQRETRNEKRATSNEQPETRNQEPETSNQKRMRA